MRFRNRHTRFEFEIRGLSAPGYSFEAILQAVWANLRTDVITVRQLIQMVEPLDEAAAAFLAEAHLRQTAGTFDSDWPGALREASLAVKP